MLHLYNNSSQSVDLAYLRGHLRKVLEILKIRKGEWNVSLVDDAAMKSLHARTMDDPTTTDVLTFDMRDDERQPLELDTVICVDEALRRAEEMGHEVKRELLLYAIHSLLHVSGFDDRTARDSARMHAREDEILTQLGVGAVYGKAGGGLGVKGGKGNGKGNGKGAGR